MITCRRAAVLISEELDYDLSLHLRAGLAFHVLVCMSCRRYRRQLGVMDEAVEEYFASARAVNPGETMPPSSKEQLKAIIVYQLDAES